MRLRKRKGADHCRAAALIAMVGVVLLGLVACGVQPDSPPLGPRPSTPPNAGPTTAPDGETPEHAARRLFPADYAQQMASTDSPEVLEGARPGRPVPIAEEYGQGVVLARWLLPGGADAVSGDMFAAMWPAAMRKDSFLVPMVKDGRVVSQFPVQLREGHWVDSSLVSYPADEIDPKSVLPFGDAYQLDRATAEVKALLGPGTQVRPVIFLPSGLCFVVGDNEGREAAAYFTYANLGPGVGPLEQYARDLPSPGQVFTPAQLKALFSP
jgi:hypothetical protein